jgi:hypothetical protein
MSESSTPQIAPRALFWRVAFTVILFAVYYAINAWLNPIGTLETGHNAALQMHNSDVDYLRSAWLSFISRNIYSFSPLILGAFLLMVWWKPIKVLYQGFRNDSASWVVAILCSAVTLLAADTGNAYYDQANWPEWYYMKPNETCFYIPDVGANKESQVKFMSQEYLDQARIPAKRFKIEHVKAESTSWIKDYWVPAGRLHCVVREPYSRKWTSTTDTGTSATNEAFRCQSSEGLTTTLDVMISASIPEEIAYRYLYFFGTKPIPGDPTDPKVIFNSIYQAQDMNVVMDKFASTMIMPTVCQELATRTLDQINRDSKEIQVGAEKTVAEALEKVGIKLISLGWGNIDPSDDVQKAINRRYQADKIQPVLPVLQAEAEIEVRRGLASALDKKGIPMPQNWAILPQNVFADLAKMLSQNPPKQ